MYTLHVLGRTELRAADGAPMNAFLKQEQAFALFVYLVIAKPGSFFRRDHLVGLFWPESNQENARTNLRKTLMTIRRSLGEEIFDDDRGDEVAIRSGAVDCDALELDEKFKRRHYQRVLELYEGPLLMGFDSVSSAFDDWLDTSRTRLADCAAAAAWSEAVRHEGDNQITEATKWARRTLELAPEDERQLRRVLALLDRIGDRLGALKLYDKFEQRLMREWRAIPAPETRALIEQIRTR